MRVVAYLTDPDVTRKILDHLGLPSAPPPRGPPTPNIASRPRQLTLDTSIADPPPLD
jgi:hypothetical protein